MISKYLYMSAKRHICTSFIKERSDDGIFPERTECLPIDKHELYTWKYDMSVYTKLFGQGMDISMDTNSDGTKVLTEYVSIRDICDNGLSTITEYLPCSNTNITDMDCRYPYRL